MKKSIILIVLLLAGCATVGTKIDQSKVDQIKDGVTTRAQLDEWFGQPNQQSLGDGNQTILTYSYVHSQASGASYVPVVNLFAGGTNTNQQVLMIAVDKNGIVVRHLMNDSKTQMKTGLL
jgi:outer membrane protein assembly factor BamE (lipoprotein component of BamABCDE complex)